MKNLSRVFFLVAIAIFLLANKASAEAIRSFDVDIQTYKDSSFLVTEYIDYDFGLTKRHGIHRVIPIVYTKNNSDYKIDLKLLKVIDHEGRPYEVKKVISGQKVNFRIGSKADTLTGKRLITVQYLVRNGVNFFDGTPEITWNVTGHDWHVPIARVNCVIHPPKGVSAHSVKFNCFTGSSGNKQPGIASSSDEIVHYQSGLLRPGDHFVANAGFPSGAIKKPGLKLHLFWWLEDWWPAFAIPLLSAFALGAVYFHFGRDPEISQDVSSSFNPPTSLRPAEVGTLVDEKCDIHDIVATVLDLANRGHITIKQLSKTDPYGFDGPSIQFVRNSNVNDDIPLAKFENEFMAGLFESDAKGTGSVFLSDLKYNFQARIPDIKEDIYKRLVEGGYFQTNPHEERQIYYSLSIILLVLGVTLLCFGIEARILVSWSIGLLLASAMAASVAPFMPSKTKKGCQTITEILSFVQFVKQAQKAEIEALARKNPQLFGQILPYTMVLGIEDRWACIFTEVLDKTPSWYEPLDYYGADTQKFDPSMFLVDIGACVRTLQSNLQAVRPPEPGSVRQPLSEGKSGYGQGGFSG